MNDNEKLREAFKLEFGLLAFNLSEEKTSTGRIIFSDNKVEEFWICYQRGYKEALNAPKHETVQQWEERAGETYPDDGPIYYFWGDVWKLCEYWMVKDSDPIDGIIVATHRGKPNNKGV